MANSNWGVVSGEKQKNSISNFQARMSNVQKLKANSKRLMAIITGVHTVVQVADLNYE
jgi:hypothetical protein